MTCGLELLNQDIHQPLILIAAVRFLSNKEACWAHRSYSGAMSSDDAYASFLDKANQDTGASKAPEESDSASSNVVNTNVPMSLRGVEQYYTSEADEPFEPVSLKWSGRNMPSESV